MIRRALTLAALLMASPLTAESFLCTLGASGLVKGDLAIDLYTDSVAGATTAVTVTAKESRTYETDYLIAGLTDATAGESTRYAIRLEHATSGTSCAYEWPLLTRTPSAIVWAPTFALAPGSNNYRVGDTQPSIRMTVRGLSADPTNGTVTYSQYLVSTGVAAVSAGTASLISATEVVDATTGDSTWTAVLERKPSASTDTLTAGTYYIQFKITFAAATCGPSSNAACIVTAPPDRSVRLTVN